MLGPIVPDKTSRRNRGDRDVSVCFPALGYRVVGVQQTHVGAWHFAVKIPRNDAATQSGVAWRETVAATRMAHDAPPGIDHELTMMSEGEESMQGGRPLAFMFGTQKSGTTWLRNLAGSLTPIDRDSEWYFPALAQSFENHFLRYANHLAEKKMALLRSNIARAWQFLVCSTGEFSFVDKSAYPCIAENGFREDLFPYAAVMKKFYFPDCRSVLIVRDPRDVLISSKYFFGRAQLAFDADYLTRFINGWARCNLHWLDAQPTLVVRFEDLKTDFEATLRALLSAINIKATAAEFDAVCARHALIDAVQHENPAFYRKGVVGDWKNELSADEASLIWEVGGDAMHAFGYCEDGSVVAMPGADKLLGDSQVLPLSWLAEQQWSDSSVAQRLELDHMELWVARPDLHVVMDGSRFPRAGAQQKLVLIVEVSWAGKRLQRTDVDYFDGSIGCQSGPVFGLTVLRGPAAAPAGPPLQARVHARSYFYGKRSLLCFELDASLGSEDRVQLQLFNGGDAEPFVGRLHSLRSKLLPLGSGLASQLSDLEPVAGA